MKPIAIFLFSFLSFTIAKAQSVGIGTTTPHSSAKLEVASTTQGFLPPRMTLAQRNAIATPAEGLVIFCYECDELQVFSSGKWNNMVRDSSCTLSGQAVPICNQVWMTKNLDVVTYRNGDIIPQVIDSTAWNTLTTGAWCYYNNDPAMGAIYGRLYNWYAVNDSRGLAPKGWHVPSDTEMTVLLNCLGGNSTPGLPQSVPIVGNKLKESGEVHWGIQNFEATNSSGFTALPSGIRTTSFININKETLFWSTTEYNTINAWDIYLRDYYGTVSHGFTIKRNGMSVRCVRD